MRGNKQLNIRMDKGLSLEVEVRYMRRKSLRLALNSRGGIEVRAPMGCPSSEISRFVNRHGDWLDERLAVFQQQQTRAQHEIDYLGETLRLEPVASGLIRIEGATLWAPSATDRVDPSTLEPWLRQQARQVFEELIERWWPAFAGLGKPRPVLRVKKMRTRWGSLSTRGYINLNLALIHLPPDLIELVVVHELCHMQHFNHGPGFKALMRSHLPDCQQREKRLSQVLISGSPLTC